MAKRRGNAEPKTLAQLGTPGVAQDPRTAITYAGQADWAIAGESRSCRECLVWGFSDDPYSYYAGTGSLKPRECMVHVEKMPGPHPKVPHYARACKRFTSHPEPPALERPRPTKEPAT